VLGLVILCSVYFLSVIVCLSVPVQLISSKTRLRNVLLCSDVNKARDMQDQGQGQGRECESEFFQLMPKLIQSFNFVSL